MADSYTAFAGYYDGLMEDACYEERCRYLLELLKRHNHEAGITLDLACGTGTLTRLLAKSGIDVYGVDSSAEMLSEAMQKSSDEGLNLLFLRQSMEKLNLYGTINTCVCTLDSINHITDPVKLRTAFDRVGLFMDNDGLFVFDVNTIYKHREILKDNTFVFENEKVFCVWQNRLCKDDTVSISLDFFEEENGVYYRSRESFCERAYSDREIKGMLENAGFAVEAVYGDMSFAPPKPDEQRAVYVARMKKSRNKEG